MSNKPITIGQLKRSLLNELSVNFSKNEAYSITRLILEHFGYAEYDILQAPAAVVDNKMKPEITKIVNELNKNRPIQYILGETFFYDLKFKVDENVLIPRPETEELVANILNDIRINNPHIIDIGCGSGCISVALAFALPESNVFALDVDEKAIAIAKANALLNGVKVEFIQKSIFDFTGIDFDFPFDIIVSNPPYVTREEAKFMLPNVLKYEPDLALFVPDSDPLIFYREIIRFSLDRLSPEGVVWVEINEKFGKEAEELFFRSGFSNVRILEDIHGKERFIKASRDHV